VNTRIAHIANWSLALLCCFAAVAPVSAYVDSLATNRTLVHKKTIRDGISPKSVVYSGNGLFFAQNMMYRHTVTVYNRDFELVKTIKDQITPADYGFEHYGESKYRGSPVEAAFSHNGTFAWITNYQMYGDSMSSPGCDNCAISQKYDNSFVYKINVNSFEIEQVIEVGSVPKYIATTPDNRYVLVSNWSSGDLSVIDIAKNEEIKRISLGRYPRGIVVDKASKYAYVTLMGSNKIARIDLTDLSKSWFEKIGSTPRHLCLDGDGKFLYATLNSSGKIVKIDVQTGKVVASIRSGSNPRSMVLSSNSAYLYAVNYFSDSVSKIDLNTMKVIERVKTKSKPIGITFDDRTNRVWVACYSGSIMVFEETAYKPLRPLYSGSTQLLVMERSGGFPNVKHGCFSEGHFRNFVKKDAPIEVGVLAEQKDLVAAVEVIETEAEAEVIPVTVVAEAPIAKKTAPELTPVVVEVEEPVKPVRKAAPPASVEIPIDAANSYYIIAGSFRSLDNALKMKGQLKSKGYSSMVIQREGKLNLVAFGAYANQSKAEAALSSIRANDEPAAWVFSR
jgi:YVTN family beta-propeller protein